jgi:hypothetical protein
MSTVPAAGPERERPVTVLYVAGYGRSGSTVLGELLDRIPDVTYVGELNFFWRRYSQRELCSCGRPLPECGFWSRVVDEAFGDLRLGRAERFARLERRVLRHQAPQVLVSTHWATGFGAAAARELLQERSRLYRALGKVTGSSWIVDTGKDPVFGACLTRLSSAVVDVVHVVRDPRGVAYSMKKQVRSDSEPRDMPRQPAAATAWRWLAKNLIVQIALKRFAHRYVLVRYEDLVAAPEACLLRIAKATGLPVADPRAAVDDLAHPPADHHLVAGNPGVRRLGGALRLSVDEEWRAGLPVRDQRLVVAICAVLMAAYGYAWRAPRNSAPAADKTRC